MTRTLLRFGVKDDAGNAIQNALVYLYGEGTTSPVADAWTAKTGGTAVTSALTNSAGQIEVWFDTPKNIDVTITDNNDAAFLADTNVIQSWSDLTKTVPVDPPPAEVLTTTSIAALPAADALTGAESMPVVQGGTKRTTPQDINRVRSGEPRYDVRAFGGWSSPTERRATIAAAIAAWGATAGELHFPPGVHDVSGGANSLPATTPSYRAEMAIVGHGTTLETTSAHGLLVDSWPADQAEASGPRLDRKFTVNGMRFHGSGNAAQIPLRIVGSVLSAVEDCCFHSLPGPDLVFCLEADVRRCELLVPPAMRGLRFRAGVDIDSAYAALWSGATAGNSAGNQPTAFDVRGFASDGTTSLISIEGIGGAVIDHCTCEGHDPINNVFVDWAGNTAIRSTVIRDLWTENTPSGAHIRAKAKGQMVINQIYTPNPAVVVDSSGSTTSLFEVGVLYLDALAARFTHGFAANDGPTWVFNHGFEDGTFDPTNSGYWTAGIVPEKFFYRSFTTAFGNVDPVIGGIVRLGVRGHLLPVVNDAYQVGSGSFKWKHGLFSGQVRADGGLGVGNSAAATTPGSIVRKTEIFDASGASLGFVPIYGSIS